MFAESLLETSWAQRARRSWTTLTSFGLQALIIGCLLLLPLWKTVGLPAARVLSGPLSWGAPPPPAPRVQHQRTVTIVRSNLADNVLIAPREVPNHVAHIEEVVAPPQMSFDRPDTGVPGGTGTGGGGPWKSIGDGLKPAIPLPVAPHATGPTFRTSSMLEGMLIRKVQPVYPPLARTAHVQGSVLVYALISKAGTMENVHAISGHPMLVPAAVEAVSQWRYRPYILNSEPIEVETQITVNFFLAAN
jgi:periplasmic protein TonB